MSVTVAVAVTVAASVTEAVAVAESETVSEYWRPRVFSPKTSNGGAMSDVLHRAVPPTTVPLTAERKIGFGQSPRQRCRCEKRWLASASEPQT